MRIVSAQEGLGWARSHGMPGVDDEPTPLGFFHESAYHIPGDSGRKTALARALLDSLDVGDLEAILWVHGFGIWPSSENLNLFKALRASLGEQRPLVDAPCHIFTGSDAVAVECLLDLCLYFVWDASILHPGQGLIVRTSHDEVLDLLARDAGSLTSLDAALSQFGLVPVDVPPGT